MSVADSKLTLPVKQWPSGDLAAWQSASRDGNPFTELSFVSNWSLSRRKKIEDAYGQYLAWLSRVGGLEPTLPLQGRITPILCDQYIAYLRERVAPATVAINISSLDVMLRMLHPKVDFTWLRRAAYYLKSRAPGSRDKEKYVVHAGTLLQVGLDLMRKATELPCRPPAAISFRDGLMVAFLATFPLRLGNFSHLQIGSHLLYRGRKYRLVIDQDETKNGISISATLPDFLAPWLELYLRKYRPVLLGPRPAVSTQGHLWISRDGFAMADDSVRSRIETRTKRAIGHAVWPHLFRDCAATSLAIDDPANIWAASDILGHRSLKTAERFYNQAGTISAGRQFHELIKRLRTEVASD